MARSIAPLAVGAIALSAWLHARGVAALVGVTLAAPPAPGVTSQPPAPAVQAPRSADAILARNPFDSTTGALDGAPPPAAPSALDCAGVRVLAISASSEPSWSLALIKLPGEREPLLRRPGGEIVAIEPGGVLLRRGDRRCVARIFDHAPAAPSGPGSAPAAATAGIAATGPASFALDRGARDALFDRASDWMGGVSVRPEKSGDAVVGLRLVSLRPGTPLDALGVRAGDVVRSVNGVDLTEPERMLEVLARVRTADRVSATVVRGGKTVQLDYEIR